MRIAFISYEFPPDSSNGGIATYVAQASAMLVHRGHEVEVFASSAHRDETVFNNGVMEHWIREVDRMDFGIVAGHRFAARHLVCPFDVLEGPEYYADARKARELVPDIPLVVKMHTPSLMIAHLNRQISLQQWFRHHVQNLKHLALCAYRRQRPVPLAFDNLQYFHDQNVVEAGHARSADLVAPPCRSLCDFAIRSWNIPAESVRLTPYPYVPVPEFLEIQPRQAGNVVGFVGRLERRKGIETLAAAIPLIRREVPDVKFRFIGAASIRPSSGEYYDKWLARTIGDYKESVEVVGKVPLAEMPRAYASLDVCVLPSLWENFPNTCLEAMSAARAIVGSAAGGMSDMLLDGAVGRLVEPADPVSLARAIISLLKSPDERVRLGLLARQRLLDAYNESTIGELTERTYSEAIEKSRLSRNQAGDVGKLSTRI